MGAVLWSQAPRLIRYATKVAAPSLALGTISEKASSSFDLSSADMENLPMAFGSHLIIQLRGDESLETKTDIPLGAAGRDISETTGLVRKKFREQAAPLIGESKVDNALEMMGGSRELLKECFHIFLNTMDDALGRLRAAVDEKDASSLNQWAHKFKGSLEHLAAGRAAGLAGRLEHMGRTNDLSHAEAAFETLSEECEKVKGFIDTW